MVGSMPEKHSSISAAHLETTSSVPPESQLQEALQHGDDLDSKVVRRLIRKVDLRIMPALGLLYALSLIDRVNLSIVSRLSIELNARGGYS